MKSKKNNITNDEILGKIFEIVKKNNFDFLIFGDLNNEDEFIEFDNGFVWFSNDMAYHINEIIFNHDFAKSFWGDCPVNSDYKAWEFHLQQMVLYKNPLEYIKEFL